MLIAPGSCGKLFTTCRHDCAVKYMTASRALIRGVLKILIVSEILLVYLVDSLFHLSVVVTGDKYCIFGRVQGA